MFIYVLIATAIASGYHEGDTGIHVEHDYPTSKACHAAYDVFVKQVSKLSDSRNPFTIAGTCLEIERVK